MKTLSLRKLSFLHLDRVLQLLVEVVASLKGGIEVVVHPVLWDCQYSGVVVLGLSMNKNMNEIYFSSAKF